MVPNIRDAIFPRFLGKNAVPGKWCSETQTLSPNCISPWNRSFQWNIILQKMSSYFLAMIISQHWCLQLKKPSIQVWVDIWIVCCIFWPDPVAKVLQYTIFSNNDTIQKLKMFISRRQYDKINDNPPKTLKQNDR